MEQNLNHRVLYWILALSVLVFGVIVYNAVTDSNARPETPELSPYEVSQIRKMEIIRGVSETGTSPKEKAGIIKSLSVDVKVSQKTKADIISSLRSK